MAEMTESQRSWEAWYDAFSRIRAAWPAELDVRCPICGEGQARITYTGDPEDRTGYAVIWCDANHHGTWFSRVGIPDGAPMLAYDASEEQRRAVMPDDIDLLPPDPYTPDDEDEDGSN